VPYSLTADSDHTRSIGEFDFFDRKRASGYGEDDYKVEQRTNGMATGSGNTAEY